MPIPRQVIVVGAGLSGLAAARVIAGAGIEVVVLEGRDRIGGRVWTVGAIDLGAHWIHGTEGNPITNLAHELGVPTLFVGGDSSYTGGWEELDLRIGGVRVDQETKEQSITLIDEIRDAVEAVRRELELSGEPDISLADAIERVVEKRGLSPEMGIHLGWHMLVLARDDWAAGTERLSTLWWDDGYEVYGYGDSVFPGGAGALIEKLATGLDVRLGTVVRSIEYGNGHVAVRTGTGVYEADAVVVTLPLGVLKSGAVTFAPPLPERKRQAVARLGMGNLTKVILTFDRPFWAERQYVFGNISSDSGGAPTLIVSLWKTHRKPVLVMLVGGGLGLELEARTPDAVSDWAKQMLLGIFGAGTPLPHSVEVTSWSQDPFSRGSYSYVALGATPEDIEALAAPVGDNLLFAGEATSRIHWGAMHGAYVSGLREAARLLGDQTLLPGRNFTENRRWRDMLQRANRFFNLAGKTLDGAELAARVDVLARSPVFESLGASDLKVLATMFSHRNLDDEEILCSAGEKAHSVFAVAAGEVLVYPPGAAAPVARKGVGDIVGEYGMFLPGGRSATLRAAGRTSVLVLDYQHFRRFLLAFPNAMLSLLGGLVVRAEAEAAERRSS